MNKWRPLCWPPCTSTRSGQWFAMPFTSGSIACPIPYSFICPYYRPEEQQIEVYWKYACRDLTLLSPPQPPTSSKPSILSPSFFKPHRTPTTPPPLPPLSILFLVFLYHKVQIKNVGPNLQTPPLQFSPPSVHCLPLPPPSSAFPLLVVFSFLFLLIFLTAPFFRFINSSNN